MTNFAVGDIISPRVSCRSLNQGQHYTVRIVEPSVGTVCLKNVYGSFFADRFELVKSEKQNKHKHADLIVQWANGAVIEQFNPRANCWKVVEAPTWAPNSLYRIKPVKTQPEVLRRRMCYVLPKTSSSKPYLTWYDDGTPNVEITVDPVTGEVLKIEKI